MSAKYYLYRNLHTGGFSIKYKGKVIEKPFCFSVKNVSFKVNENSRQSVIKNQKRQVHAYVIFDHRSEFNSHNGISDLIRKSETKIKSSNYKEVNYNPYHNTSFVINETGKPIFETSEIIGYNGKIYAKVGD